VSEAGDRVSSSGAAQAQQTWQAPAVLVARVDRYLAAAATVGSPAVMHTLRADLGDASSVEWRDVGRQFLQRGQPLFAAAVLELALQRYPAISELRYWLGYAQWQAGQVDRAEAELRRVLAGEMHAGASQLLAQLLRGQGRFKAAAACMAAVARVPSDDIGGVLGGIQFVRECHQQSLAAELCAEHLSRGMSDPRLHALAGQIEQELGHFEQARACYVGALAQGINLNEWFVLGSLASLQRYVDRQHADFAMFGARLQDRTLAPRARASILFALGKACDDIGAYADAANAWRQANQLMRNLHSWPRPAWKDFVQARVTAVAPPLRGRHADCVPIFVVGLPRTGTTLMAELLGRHPGVCNRGELPTLEYLAAQLMSLPAREQAAHVSEAAEIYLTHLRRDDAPLGHYIDKNPLNFRYLDYVTAMFPQARVIHCRRHARDTALSIWSQPFARDEYAFARDFGDIAALAEGCDVLMAHWRRSLPMPIITVDYEQLVADPAAMLAGLWPRLGLVPDDLPSIVHADQPAPITSASLWQARQPVHKRSVARWRHYGDLLPELVQLFADE